MDVMVLKALLDRARDDALEEAAQACEARVATGARLGMVFRTDPEAEAIACAAAIRARKGQPARMRLPPLCTDAAPRSKSRSRPKRGAGKS